MSQTMSDCEYREGRNPSTPTSLTLGVFHHHDDRPHADQER